MAEITYIIEYDLPANSKRRRFYRAIKRYLTDKSLEGTGWSTNSVIITPDEDFAWYLHEQALKIGGTSHIYRATQLDTEALNVTRVTEETPINALEERGSE